MGGTLTVYVCEEPEHEELVRTIREVLNNVRGRKPKLKVVRLKLKKAEDFPYYLSKVEELFGGVATAEYRKYGIRSLPAIVYNNRAILQGKIPSREEIEEALAYEGLKIVRETPVTRPAAPQPAPPPATKPLAPAAKPAAGSAPSAAPRERVKVEIPLRILPPAAPSAAEAPAQSKPSEPVAAAPPPRQPAAARVGAAPSKTPMEAPRPGRPPLRALPESPQLPLVEVEELEVRAVSEVPAASGQPTKPGKSCTACVFYDRGRGRCLLYRVAVADPSRPPCAR